MEEGRSITKLIEQKRIGVANIQAFLIHERLYNITCFNRLLEPFAVDDFDTVDARGNICVKFVDGGKFWIKESDLKNFNNNNKRRAVRITVNEEFDDGHNHLIDISLSAHGLSKMEKDMKRLKGVVINHNGIDYKTLDVHYVSLAMEKVEDIVRLRIREYMPTENFINDRIISKNKTEHIGNGINFETFGEQEPYLKLADVKTALHMERKYITKELVQWFQECGASSELMEELNKKIDSL